MLRHVVIALGMVTCSIDAPAVVGQEPPAKPKARIELRWVEIKQIDGVTEQKGILSSEDPKSIVYPRKQAALVLTAAEITEATLRNYDLSESGLSAENYQVTFHLTKQARDRLATACGDQESRLLTVFVDGACWQVLQWYHKGPIRGASDGDRAETFLPVVGFFPKASAERLVDAVK
jgi:hypothetical protein